MTSSNDTRIEALKRYGFTGRHDRSFGEDANGEFVRYEAVAALIALLASGHAASDVAVDDVGGASGVASTSDRQLQYAELVLEHLGDIDRGTGIYAPRPPAPAGASSGIVGIMVEGYPTPDAAKNGFYWTDANGFMALCVHLSWLESATRIVQAHARGWIPSDEQYVAAAREADLLAETCRWVEYDPDVGVVPGYWKPRFPSFAHALLKQTVQLRVQGGTNTGEVRETRA